MAINLMAITAFDFVAKLLIDGRKQPDETKKAAFPLFRGKPHFFLQSVRLASKAMFIQRLLRSR